MSDLRVELKGAEELKRTLAAIGARTPKEGAAALYAEAEVVRGVSFQRTPKDTGNLRDSHAVSKPRIAGQEITVTLGVGGPAAPYAIYVHENLTAHHPIGQAKFLESAIHEAASNWTERLAKRIDLNRLKGVG